MIVMPMGLFLCRARCCGVRDEQVAPFDFAQDEVDLGMPSSDYLILSEVERSSMQLQDIA
jgi:hypothetical protein